MEKWKLQKFNELNKVLHRVLYGLGFDLGVSQIRYLGDPGASCLDR